MIKKLIKKFLDALGVQVRLQNKKSLPINPLFSQFTEDWHPVLDSSSAFIKRLLTVPNARLWQEDDKILFNAIGITIQVETQEDFFILNEIFFDGDYNLSLPQEYVLIDIGMNVGITSLFFANKPEVVKVFAYEPMETTLRQAERNLKMNLSFSQKISTHNFGLSNYDHMLEIPYTYQWKGSVGVNELSEKKKKANDLTTVSVELRDVAQEIRKIKALFPELPLIAKIDCEGSEYAIISRLAQEGLLEEVSIYMIEWHYQGPTALEEALRSEGFTCLSKAPYTNIVGMIYAFNNNIHSKK